MLAPKRERPSSVSDAIRCCAVDRLEEVLRVFRDIVTHFIGLGILVYTGFVLWGPLTTGGLDGIDRAQRVLALLGGFVGTVLGYYFGVRQGEKAAERAEQHRAATTNTAEQELADVRKLAEEVKKLI